MKIENINYKIWWEGFKPATCIEWGCWCEAPRLGSLILEPVNTFTNISMIILGFYLLYQVNFKKNPSYILIAPIFSNIFSFSTLFLGLTSGLFHASRTFIGEWFDVFGMYMISMYFLLVNFVKAGKLSAKAFIFAYYSSLTALGVYIYLLPKGTSIMFGAHLAFIFFHSQKLNTQSQNKARKDFLFKALGIFLIGLSAWILDRTRLVCDPYAVMNGHGIWHIFNGIAAYFVFRFFSSDSSFTKS